MTFLNFLNFFLAGSSHRQPDNVIGFIHLLQPSIRFFAQNGLHQDDRRLVPFLYNSSLPSHHDSCVCRVLREGVSHIRLPDVEKETAIYHSRGSPASGQARGDADRICGLRQCLLGYHGNIIGNTSVGTCS